MAKEILIQLLEFGFPIVQGKVLVNRVGEFMEFLIEGGVAFPFGLFDEGVDHFLDQRRLKPQFHGASLTSLFSVRYDLRTSHYRYRSLTIASQRNRQRKA